MRLLEVEGVLTSLVMHQKDEFLATVGQAVEAKLKANRIIRKIKNGLFWEDLRGMVVDLLPIKIALRMMERDTARLDIVTTCYGKLYNHFGDISGTEFDLLYSRQHSIPNWKHFRGALHVHTKAAP